VTTRVDVSSEAAVAAAAEATLAEQIRIDENIYQLGGLVQGIGARCGLAVAADPHTVKG
jgi:hypothetical protein